MDETHKIKTVYVGGMICDCCIRLMKMLLEKEDLHFAHVNIGAIDFYEPISDLQISKFLKKHRFSLVTDKNEIIVNQIKVAVIELVHYANNNSSIIRNSDYLVEKIGRSYQSLSTIFADIEQRTLEKYIIAHKVERTKSLLIQDEMSLSEIAFQMGYSSVQYLSNQFKKTTGMTVSEFKKQRNPKILPLDQV